MSSTASRLDIYNMALGFIGSRTVGSPNERCNEAIQCELYWDRARRSALRDYPYSFAMRRAFLAEKPFPEVYEGDWRNCYSLPDKCLRIMSVHLPLDHKRGPFVQVYTDEGVSILTDVNSAVADYIHDVEDISQWDESFVLSMARKLACLVCIPILKNNTSKLNELETLYQQTIPKIQGLDSCGYIQREQLRTIDWLDARGGTWLDASGSKWI